MGIMIGMQFLQTDKRAATGQLDNLHRPSICAKIFGVVKEVFAKIKESFLWLFKPAKEIAQCLKLNAEILNTDSSCILDPFNGLKDKNDLLDKLEDQATKFQQKIEESIQKREMIREMVNNLEWAQLDARFAVLCLRDLQLKTGS